MLTDLINFLLAYERAEFPEPRIESLVAQFHQYLFNGGNPDALIDTLEILLDTQA